MMDWALYYDDRTLFTSEDGDWSDAPAWGVQAVVISAMPAQERVIRHGDFYFIPAGATQPWSGDTWGVIDKLIYEGRMDSEEILGDFTPAQLIMWGIKFGRMMDTDSYAELEQFIRADSRLKFPELTTGSTTLDTRREGLKAWSS